jgi:hypothetical protein
VSLQVDELLDDRLLALLARPESRGEPVDLGVVTAELVETGVPLPGAGRGRRVDPVQVGDDLSNSTWSAGVPSSTGTASARITATWVGPGAVPPADRDPGAARSRSRTSASVVWVKSQ